MGLPRNGGHFTDQPSCTSGRLPGGQFSQPLRFDGPFQARDRLDASLSPLGPTGLATAYELNRLMFVAPSIRLTGRITLQRFIEGAYNEKVGEEAGAHLSTQTVAPTDQKAPIRPVARGGGGTLQNVAVISSSQSTGIGEWRRYCLAAGSRR